MSTKNKSVISEELALVELSKFVDMWVDGTVEESELKESYPSIFDAICKGNLVFNDDLEPVYELINPIKNDDGAVSISTVNFKTRITPTNQARLAKGIDIKNDQIQFMLVCIAHIIGQPIAMLDKFSKKDYIAIRELSTVFM